MELEHFEVTYLHYIQDMTLTLDGHTGRWHKTIMTGS